VTVPLVEELVWRGIVFSVLLTILRKFLPESTSGTLAAVFSGVCFGLLHSTNALFGYPLAFVALQTLNATVWGVVYGIARAKTGSIYPSIMLHAAMNLAVALA
jgi:membrane protease YdiL (CAAX protease family)